MGVVRGLGAPFPYAGGKSRHAERVWGWLGDPQAYVEPFCGSAAVLLRRPESGRPRRRELINDKSGWVANFWRAVKADPVGVAAAMDWPNSQVEFAARQAWFDEAGDVNGRLRGDADWFDVRLAGVWAWGVSCSISGKYPSGSINQQGYTKHYQGANQRNVDLYDWCQRLAERLRYVQVHAGNWELCLRPSAHMDSSRHSVGVFLDPPYDPKIADTTMYEHGTTYADAAEWAFNNGDNEHYRIVLCGFTGTYDTPDGWRFEPLGKVGKSTRRQEGVWLSPAIVNDTKQPDTEMTLI